MIPSLEGLPTKAKEAPSPNKVRLAPLDTNPVFHSLGDEFLSCILFAKLSILSISFFFLFTFFRS